MKKLKLLLFVSIQLFGLISFSQISNNDKALLYFTEAEKSFNQNEFHDALNFIKKAENELGSTNGRILNLKIKTYYNLGWFSSAETSFNTFSNEYSNSVTQELKEDTYSYFIRIEKAANAVREKNAKVQVAIENFEFESCGTCGGDGMEADFNYSKCAHTEKRGYPSSLTYVCNNGYLYLAVSGVKNHSGKCPRCKGNGYTKHRKLDKTCTECNGDKKIIVYKGDEYFSSDEINQIKRLNETKIKEIIYKKEAPKRAEEARLAEIKRKEEARIEEEKAWIIKAKKDFAGPKGRYTKGTKIYQKNGKWGKINANGVAVIPFKYDKIHKNIWESGVFIVELNNKEGLLNQKGDIIIPIKYDNLIPTDAGFGGDGKIWTARLHNKEGVINLQNEILIPFLYDEIQWIPAENHFYLENAYFKVEINGKIGVIKSNGEIVLPIIYDSIVSERGTGHSTVLNGVSEIFSYEKAIPMGKYEYQSDFKNGLAIVQLHNLYGVINKLDKLIIPIEHYDIKRMSNGFFRVKNHTSYDKPDQYGLYNSEGTLVAPVLYESIELDNDLIRFKQNGKYGFFNQKGSLVLPLKYDKIDWDDDGFYRIFNDNKVGIANEKGELIVPAIYKRIYFVNYKTQKAFKFETDDYKDGFLNAKTGKSILDEDFNLYGVGGFHDEEYKTTLYMAKLNDKYGLVDGNYNIIVPIIYDNMYDTKNNDNTTLGRLFRVKLDDKTGYIDEKGKVVIQIKYENETLFHGSIDYPSEAKLDGKWGVINKNEDEVISIAYDFIRYDESHEIFPVELNGKWGFINKNEELIIPYKYDSAKKYHNDIAEVSVNDKWGFIDAKGKLITPLKYDVDETWNSGFTSNGSFAIVNLNNRKGLINRKGKEIIPILYDELNYLENGLAAAKLNGFWGYVNKNGKTIIPFKFESAYDFGELFVKGNKEHAMVTLNGKKIIIDKKGKKVKDYKG